eukprot:gene179-1640_t
MMMPEAQVQMQTGINLCKNVDDYWRHLNATGPAGLALYTGLHRLLSSGQVTRARKDVAAWMITEKLGSNAMTTGDWNAMHPLDSSQKNTDKEPIQTSPPERHCALPHPTAQWETCEGEAEAPAS